MTDQRCCMSCSVVPPRMQVWLWLCITDFYTYSGRTWHQKRAECIKQVTLMLFWNACGNWSRPTNDDPPSASSESWYKATTWTKAKKKIKHKAYICLSVHLSMFMSLYPSIMNLFVWLSIYRGMFKRGSGVCAPYPRVQKKMHATSGSRVLARKTSENTIKILVSTAKWV